MSVTIIVASLNVIRGKRLHFLANFALKKMRVLYLKMQQFFHSLMCVQIKNGEINKRRKSPWMQRGVLQSAQSTAGTFVFRARFPFLRAFAFYFHLFQTTLNSLLSAFRYFGCHLVESSFNHGFNINSFIILFIFFSASLLIFPFLQTVFKIDRVFMYIY